MDPSPSQAPACPQEHLRGPQDGPRRAPGAPKISPRRRRRGRQCPQDGLCALEERPIWLQDCPRGPQNAPRGPPRDPPRNKNRHIPIGKRAILAYSLLWSSQRQRRPKRPPRSTQDGAKRPPRAPQDGPSGLQDGPEEPQNGPRETPEGPQRFPREPQEGHRRSPREPRRAPRGPKEGPKTAQAPQDGARGPQDGPRGPQDDPKEALFLPMGPLGNLGSFF